ncbi:MAG TPA: response regulator [Woeseiaceae bacterium]|nr:response regulator [Woeseiaceae bacterium]
MGKILLVEDNQMNRDMLSRRLRRKGFEVLLATDGQEGISLARSGAPDLILMDMSLPTMDGWTAARLLKSDTDTRSIPIIALTAHAMRGDRDKALDAGCDEYETKPVNLARLLGKIESLTKSPLSP